MQRILTLDNHLNKFDKVINGKWKNENDLRRRINLRIKLLKTYYKDPHESDDFVRPTECRSYDSEYDYQTLLRTHGESG